MARVVRAALVACCSLLLSVAVAVPTHAEDDPPPAAAPTITEQPASSTVVSGGTATFTAHADAAPTPTVKWQADTGAGFVDLADDTRISGSTTETLSLSSLTIADSGMQVRAVFTNGVAPDATTNTATLTVNKIPMTPGTPTISGTVAVGQTLTADPGTWTPADPAFSYSWLVGDVEKGTTSTYDVVAGDVGKTIKVKVTGTKAEYATTDATSAETIAVPAQTLQTDTPTISGNVELGATVTAVPGANWTAGTDFTYQWKFDGNNISGATKSTYKLLIGSVGKKLSVVVTGSKTGYTTESKESAQTTVTKPAYGPNIIRISGQLDSTSAKATFEWKGHPTLSSLPLAKFQIKGNSSVNWPKKPYYIKLKTGTSLYGMPADTEWRLLANYHDRSLVRDKVSFDLAGHMSGLAWTPRSVFAELFLNGKYLGSYELTEQIKAGTNRVNISGTGSQIMEFDYSGKYIFKDAGGMDESFYAPKSTTNSSAIKTKANKFINTLKANGDWKSLIDVPSFVDYYLVREFTKDNDADFLHSNFWHTNPGASSKIVMGPVWDFDRSAGNEEGRPSQDPEGWYMRGPGYHTLTGNKHWYVALTKTAYFKQQLCNRWNEPAVHDLFEHVSDDGVAAARADVGEVAADNDTAKWGSGATRPPKRGSGYQGEVNYISQWYAHRYNWIDDHICD